MEVLRCVVLLSCILATAFSHGGHHMSHKESKQTTEKPSTAITLDVPLLQTHLCHKGETNRDLVCNIDHQHRIVSIGDDVLGQDVNHLTVGNVDAVDIKSSTLVQISFRKQLEDEGRVLRLKRHSGSHGGGDGEGCCGGMMSHEDMQQMMKDHGMGQGMKGGKMGPGMMDGKMGPGMKNGKMGSGMMDDNKMGPDMMKKSEMGPGMMMDEDKMGPKMMSDTENDGEDDKHHHMITHEEMNKMMSDNNMGPGMMSNHDEDDHNNNEIDSDNEDEHDMMMTKSEMQEMMSGKNMMSNQENKGNDHQDKHRMMSQDKMNEMMGQGMMNGDSNSFKPLPPTSKTQMVAIGGIREPSASAIIVETGSTVLITDTQLFQVATGSIIVRGTLVLSNCIVNGMKASAFVVTGNLILHNVSFGNQNDEGGIYTADGGEVIVEPVVPTSNDIVLHVEIVLSNQHGKTFAVPHAWSSQYGNFMHSYGLWMFLTGIVLSLSALIIIGVKMSRRQRNMRRRRRQEMDGGPEYSKIKPLIPSDDEVDLIYA